VRAAAALAAAALACLAALQLYLAARPLSTDDLWWHLAMGKVYSARGPWPGAEPLLHTGNEDAPLPHEWLFSVALHQLERAVGLHGLRVAHGLAVLGILALAGSLFRREARSAAAACLATAIFIVLAWWRLFQLRPDLVSIPATLLLYRLLLEGRGPPSWARVAGSVALLVVWANLHSLFAIGPLLLMAALAGLALRWLLAKGALAGPASGDAAAPGQRDPGRRVALALGIGLPATLLNPRGARQHLMFLTSSRESAIWLIDDEWSHFDPFAWGGRGPELSPLAHATTDLLLGAFLVVALLGIARVAVRRSPAALRAFDPVLLALGFAGAAALLVSVRFLWMSVFPLLFLLRAGRMLEAAQPGVARRVEWGLAGACVALVAAYPVLGGFERALDSFPSGARDYGRSAYAGEKYHVAGVRFLEETGVEGNLFNSYPMGGFLAYRLSPRLRTFIDGRTADYALDVVRDYVRVSLQRPDEEGESFLDALDRRRVDLFFGVGLPAGPRDAAGRLYTTANLERAPGWIPVFRSLRHAIYLRTNERNRENLERVSRFYAREKVAFDPERGLDVDELVRARSDWCMARGILPPHYAQLLAARASPDPDLRPRAREALGVLYAVIGAYREQVANDREAAAERGGAKAPRRRLVFGLLHLDRPAEALAAAGDLLAIDPRDPRSRIFAEAAHAYAEARGGAGPRGSHSFALLGAPLNSLPLLDP